MSELPALRAQERGKNRRNLGLGALALLLIVLGAALWFGTTNRANDAEVQRDQATAEKLSLAEQMKRECDVGRSSGPICDIARQVAAAPTPPPTPAEKPRDGRGIVSTNITGGHLLVAYTDGAIVDVGPVQGSDGRGIASTVVTDGRLTVTYTDGKTADLGPVVGPVGTAGADGKNGRGITSVASADGRLIVTYDDGKTQDAGPLPPGPTGATGASGPPGPACRDPYQPVDTGDVTAADGTRYSRSLTCVDPSSAQPARGSG